MKYETTVTYVNEHETVIRVWRIDEDGTEVLVGTVPDLHDAPPAGAVVARFYDADGSQVGAQTLVGTDR